MAGGNDSLDWFKDRAKRPKAVIDLGGIAELKGIRETADGIEIGALTTLTEIERNPIIKERTTACSPMRPGGSPARRSATPARSAATSRQDARCWYYRSGLPLLPRRRQHLLCRYAGRA